MEMRTLKGIAQALVLTELEQGCLGWLRLARCISRALGNDAGTVWGGISNLYAEN